MKRCPFYSKSDVGLRYAALTDPKILTGDDGALNEEERRIRDEFADFERHFFACADCSERLREDQELCRKFERLAASREGRNFIRNAMLSHEATIRRPAYRWVARAASFLLVSTMGLALWAAWVVHRPGEPLPLKAPETVALKLALEPDAPLERSTHNDEVVVPATAASYLLTVNVELEEWASRRFDVRILDEAGRLRWEAPDATPDPDGTLMVYLRQGFLEPGAYRLQVKVFDRSTSREETTVPCAFRVE